jgi:hypothetical protein
LLAPGVFSGRLFPGMNGNSPWVIQKKSFYIKFIINSGSAMYGSFGG